MLRRADEASDPTGLVVILANRRGLKNFVLRAIYNSALVERLNAES